MSHAIYTVGYSAGWTPASLKAELKRLNAQLLDIRYSPRSRSPEWNRGALERYLGPEYRHIPALGNRNYRGGPIELADPERALPLVAQMLSKQPVVMLCVCYDADACHRRHAATYMGERLGVPVFDLAAPVGPHPFADEEHTVISLNPPYGSLIAAAAIAPKLGKSIETRSKPTKYPKKQVLIQQTSGLGSTFRNDAELAAFCHQEPFRSALYALGYEKTGDLPRGAIVASCDIVDCVRVTATNIPDEPERSFGWYSLDEPRYMWKLANIRLIEQPIPASGAQGFWKWYGKLPFEQVQPPIIEEAHV